MASLNMDSPLSVSPQVQLTKTVQDTRDCVQELKKEFADLGSSPLTDDSQNLQRFCAKLEFLLQAGLKSKSSLLGGKKDYWNYFCDCLAANKGLNDGIRFVKSISELKTNLGKGRAFLRFCLVQKRLADSLQQCVYNKRVTGDWYHPISIWHHQVVFAPLINELYDLNDLQFDLSPHGYDLDASWPTFARKTFGGAAYSWAPPSRSTSISSLASIPYQQPEGLGFPSSYSSHADPELERVKSELNETENEKIHLQVKLESTEEERRSLLRKTKEMEDMVAQLQKDKSDAQIQSAKLESELKAKEAAFMERASLYEDKIRTSEAALSELRGKAQLAEVMEAAVKTNAATSDMQALEQRMKQVALQKEMAALKIELKNSNLQLQMKVKIDEGKTKLIETLEARLTKSENSKKELLEKVESFFAKHEREEQGNFDLVDQMKQLKLIMVEKEKANDSLKKINTELRSMLKDLEDKSQKISALAKEKVLKYVDQNKDLQQTIETLRITIEEKDLLLNGAKDVDIDAKVREVIEEKHKLLGDKESLKLEIETLKSSLQEVQENIKDLQKSASREGIDGASEENPISMMKSLQEKAEKQRRESDSQDGPESPKKSGEMAKLQSLNADLEVKLSEMKSQLLKMEELNEDLTQNIAEKNTLIKTLETELSNAKNVLTTVENGLDGHAEAMSQDSEEPSAKLLKKIKKLLDDQQHLQIQLQTAEAGHLQLKKANETLNQQYTEVSEESKSQSLQIAELKTLISKSDVSNADLEARSEELGLDLQEKVKVIENLEVKVKESENCLTETKKTLESVKKILEEKEAVLTQMESDKTLAERQLRDLKENLDLLNSQGDKAEQEVRDIVNESLNLKEQLHKQSDELNTVKEQVEILGKEKKEIETRLKLKEEELDHASAALEDMELNVCKSVEDKIMTIKSRLSEERESRKSLEDEIDKVREKHRINEEQLKAITESQKQDKEKYLNSIDELTSQLKDLMSEKDKMENTLRDGEKEKLTITEERDKLQSVKENLESEITQLKAHLEKEKTEKDLLKEELDRLKVNIEELTESNTELQKQVRDLEENLQSATSEVEELTVKRNNLQQSYDDLLQECDKSKGSADQATFKLEGALEFIKEKDKIIEDLEEKINELENDKSNFKLEVDNLTVEANELRHSVNVLEAENNILVENLTRSNNDMSEKYDSLSHDKSKLLEKLTEMTNQGKDFKSQVEKLMQEKSDARDYGDRYEAKFKKKEKEFAALKEEFDALKLQLQEKEDEAQKKVKELAKSKDSLEKEVSALQFQLSAEHMQHKSSSADLSELEEKLAHQEALVDALELELNDVRTEREHEESRRWKELEEIKTKVSKLSVDEDVKVVRQHRDQLIRELEELRRSIQDKDEECRMLGGELSRTSMMLEEEKSLSLKIKNEALEMEERLTKELEAAKSSEASLLEDYTKIKDQLVKIVKDKAMLWQQNDNLEDVRKLFVHAKWLDSSKVTKCMDCSVEFSLLNRKHHCRKCGRIFCHACSNNFIEVPYSKKNERVCNECIMTMSHLESSVIQMEESDEPELSHDGNEMRSTPVDGSLKTGAPAGTRSSVIIGSHPEAAPSSSGILGSLLGVMGFSPGGSTESQNLSTSPSVNTSDALQPTTSTPTKALSGSLQTAPGSLTLTDPISDREGHSEGAESDENYDVITDQEIMQSMHESMIESDPSNATSMPLAGTVMDMIQSMPAPIVPVWLATPIVNTGLTLQNFGTRRFTNMSSTASMVTVEQIESGQVTYDDNLWVAAGRVYAVPVLIDDPGVTLCWEFTTQPKDIGFGATYRETSITEAKNMEVLIDTIKCNSHKRPIQGELLARKAGVYTLLFDNTHSRFTSKQLTYKLDTKIVYEDDPPPDQDGRQAESHDEDEHSS